ncbi:MAG: hypothetical protein KDD25_07635, partial [Bdellovibrionales bacterium]|nr:hypothetical protein [Bdellovibrionales bacterium]
DVAEPIVKRIDPKVPSTSDRIPSAVAVAKSAPAIQAHKIESAIHPSTAEFDEAVFRKSISMIDERADVLDWQTKFQTLSKTFESGEYTSEQVYIDFVQQIDGIPVEDEVIHTMSVKLDSGYQVVLAEGRLNKLPPVDTRELVSEGRALKIAKELTHPTTDRLWKNKRVIREMDGEHRSVREIQYRGNEKMAVVDTVTGRTWVETESYSLEGARARFLGFGTGFFAITDEGIQLEPLPLPNLAVVVNPKTKPTVIYTNEDGGFDFPAADAVDVRVSMTGKFFEIYDNAQGRMALGGRLEAAAEPLNVAFNQKDPTEYNMAQVNAYHHANLIRKFFVDNGISNESFNEPMPVRVNLDLDSCNASYGGGAANFFMAGGGCVNSAYDTVLYHEYGHFVDDAFGGIISSGLSEGWGDVIAILVTGQPTVGQDFKGPGTDIRSGENSYKYVESDDCGRCRGRGDADPHELGQAWAGFVWTLKKELSKTLSEEGASKLVKELVLPSLKSNARSIPQAVKEVALRDDNDGNLSNGTRHWSAVVAAARAHGLENYLK